MIDRADDILSAPGPQLQTTSLCFQSLTADSDKEQVALRTQEDLGL